jgi:hypothetical protein
VAPSFPTAPNLALCSTLLPQRRPKPSTSGAPGPPNPSTFLDNQHNDTTPYGPHPASASAASATLTTTTTIVGAASAQVQQRSPQWPQRRLHANGTPRSCTPLPLWLRSGAGTLHCHDQPRVYSRHLSAVTTVWLMLPPKYQYSFPHPPPPPYLLSFGHARQTH